MQAKELTQKTVEELKQELTDLTRQQFKLRMKKNINQLEDTSQIRKVRRSIARVKTVLTQMQAE